MQPRHLTPDVSDEDRGTSPAGSARGAASRRRSTRACDQCRRTKSKCERSDVENICRACAAMGVSCTYVGPSHKRGPPKGYILALERRLHQVEALLGTIISSDDPRARGLVNDLSRDQLAAHIVRRVKIGPFGPRGRLQQPFGSTKEDFLAAIMAGSGDDSPGRYGEENYALVSPDRDWQDRLQALLTTRQSSGLQYAPAPAAGARHALPSFRQLASPQPQQQQQQQQQQQHQPSQSHPLMQSTIPVTYSTKLETGSPVDSAAMLSPLHASYGSHSPQPPAGYHHSAAHGGGGGRLSWDGFNGYARMGGADGGAEDAEPKTRYELAPADASAPAAGAYPSGAAASGMPRLSTESSAPPSVSSVPRPGAYDADARFGAYSDPQRWYYANQPAVG